MTQSFAGEVAECRAFLALKGYSVCQTTLRVRTHVEKGLSGTE